jgi:hypothetical protein
MWFACDRSMGWAWVLRVRRAALLSRRHRGGSDFGRFSGRQPDHEQSPTRRTATPAWRSQVHAERRLSGVRCTRARARRRQAHAEWRLSGVRCTRSGGSAASGAHGHGLGGVRRMRSGGLAASGAHARRSWDPGVAPATLSDHRVPVCDPAVVGNHCRRTRTTPTCFPADTSSAGPGRAGGRGELGRASRAELGRAELGRVGLSRAGLSWAGLSWAGLGRGEPGRVEPGRVGPS